MKTTTLKIIAAAVLGLASVSAVNAAPAVFSNSTLIAYDQGGKDPFPTSAPEAGVTA